MVPENDRAIAVGERIAAALERIADGIFTIVVSLEDEDQLAEQPTTLDQEPGTL